jgi:hypothetical protein
MAELKIFLVQKFANNPDWGEGDGYYIALKVLGFLQDVIKGSGAFDSVDYTFEGTRNAVGQRDVVCYLVKDKRDSLVAKNTSQPLGKNGSTFFATSGMISEVYLDAAGTYNDRDDILAVNVMHELMHNKLDAHPDKNVFADIHKINGASIALETTNASSTPSSADIGAMRKGIGLAIPQFTGGM